MITTEQKLAALRDILQTFSYSSNPDDWRHDKAITAIIADLEHLPALVSFTGLVGPADKFLCRPGMCTRCTKTRAALAHFTEAGEHV